MILHEERHLPHAVKGFAARGCGERFPVGPGHRDACCALTTNRRAAQALLGSSRGCIDA
jgi:hypothetical protein